MKNKGEKGFQSKKKEVEKTRVCIIHDTFLPTYSLITT